MDKQPSAYVDLRVDSDPYPIATLARLWQTLVRLWQEYESVADLYVARAMEPDSIIAMLPSNA